ncbi:hypothetical protein BHM03_00061805 [Ensete ventricosum]|nr:hypothetical protein BHM03_00061805 [Ensete ventricosum]
MVHCEMGGGRSGHCGFGSDMMQGAAEDEEEEATSAGEKGRRVGRVPVAGQKQTECRWHGRSKQSSSRTEEPLCFSPGCLVLGRNPRPEEVAAPRRGHRGREDATAACEETLPDLCCGSIGDRCKSDRQRSKDVTDVGVLQECDGADDRSIKGSVAGSVSERVVEATTARGRNSKRSAGSKVVAHVGKEPYLVWKQRAEMRQGEAGEAVDKGGNGATDKVQQGSGGELKQRSSSRRARWLQWCSSAAGQRWRAEAEIQQSPGAMAAMVQRCSRAAVES